MKHLKVGLIGYGYWGRNIARTIKTTDNLELFSIFDLNQKSIKSAAEEYDFKIFDTIESFLESEIEAVFIATPLKTHYELIKKSLKAKKHIFVEKPFAQTLLQTKELIELAKKVDKKLFVDFVFLYSNAVKYLKREIESFGKILYINSQRLNFGLFRDDDGVIDDLAIHDLYIIDHLIDLNIKRCCTTTQKYKNYSNNKEAIANILIDTISNIHININVSWINPSKVRSMIIVGENKTAVYDDTIQNKIKIYSTGSYLEEKFKNNELYNNNISYPENEIFIPKLDDSMALNNAIEAFRDYILYNRKTLSSEDIILKSAQILQRVKKERI